MKKLLISAVLSLATTSAFAAHLVVRNTNLAGVGFNDTTPATPVGGNAGTTIGQQRLNVFQRAADIWGALLDSKIDIPVDASFPSVFEQHMFDITAGLHWDQMTNGQRITSSTNDQKVVWDGNSTTTAALKFLGGTPTFRISAPASVAKTYQINTAAFGPRLTTA